MGPLSDAMLDSGCARHIEVAHGEPIKVLSGLDAGKTFYAVKETESDVTLLTELGEDRRGKRILRFRDTTGVPRLASQDILQTADGHKWTAVRAPQDGYLTTDFEARQIVGGKDT